MATINYTEDKLKEARKIVASDNGKKGGKARMAKLTKEELSELGKSAVNKRWEKKV